MRICIFAICLIQLLGLFIGNETLADENATGAGAYLRMGVGARALAMGGAFVAVADDPTASYWNPAGLTQIRRIQLAAMHSHMSLNRGYNFVSGILPFNQLAFGVSWLGFGISGIEARTSNTIQPDYIFGDSENAFLFSFAKGFGPLFSIGVNCKVIHHKLDKYQALGTGFDVGLLINPWYGLKVGMAFQDIATSLKWAEGHQDFFPLCKRLGVSYMINRGLLLSMDIFQQARGPVNFSFGTEYKAFNGFPLRIGADRNGNFVMGAGLEIPLNTTKLALDYSFSKDELAGGNTHRLSMIVSFGNNQPPRGYQPKKRIVKITAKYLKVRKGPGKKFKRIGIVKKGQKFIKLDRVGNWYEIKIGSNKGGWIYAKHAREISS